MLLTQSVFYDSFCSWICICSSNGNLDKVQCEWVGFLYAVILRQLLVSSTSTSIKRQDNMHFCVYYVLGKHLSSAFYRNTRSGLSFAIKSHQWYQSNCNIISEPSVYDWNLGKPLICNLPKMSTHYHTGQ